MDDDRHLTTVPATREGLRWLALAGFVLFAAAAGYLGNLLQGDDVAARYLSFERPAWAPPSEAFGIVWPVLYLVIGVAAWRVWSRAGSLGAARVPLLLWVLQLVINAVWPGVFFGLNQFGWAIPVIIVLVVVVAITVAEFQGIDRLAASLLAPYLAWIVYATALNIALYLMN